MPGGCPPQFKSVEELQKAIDAYFADCDERGAPYTVTGLALACDLTRQGLINYEKKDQFVDTIKKAKMKVENSIEEKLMIGGNSTAGCIFNLKNNYGWKDKSEQELSGPDGSKLFDTIAFKVVKANANPSTDDT